VLRQQTFGQTRVDYVLEREGGGLVLVEVRWVDGGGVGGGRRGRMRLAVY